MLFGNLLKLPVIPRSAEKGIIGLLSVSAGIIIWELVVILGLVNPILLSAPTSIINAFIKLIESGELQRNLAVSGLEFIVGFFISLLVGIPVAVLAGWYRRFGWVMQPLIAVLFCAPTIALFPLIILFFGIGFWDKVFLVALSGFLQLFIAITTGIRATDHRWTRLARSFGASRPRMFWSVIVPGALPFVLLGVRLAIGRSLVNVVVAEMLASEAGLGHMIAFYGNTFRVDNVFVAIFSVVVIGVILDQIFLVAERRLMRWRPPVN